MEQTLIDLENNLLLPRELWEKIINFSGIYKTLWNNKIKASFREIKKHNSLYVLGSIYNVNTKQFKYRLHKYSKPEKTCVIITNYSEERYKWEPLVLEPF